MKISANHVDTHVFKSRSETAARFRAAAQDVYAYVKFVGLHVVLAVSIRCCITNCQIK